VLAANPDEWLVMIVQGVNWAVAAGLLPLRLPFGVLGHGPLEQLC